MQIVNITRWPLALVFLGAGMTATVLAFASINLFVHAMANLRFLRSGGWDAVRLGALWQTAELALYGTVVLINWLTFGDEMLNWQETWPVPVFTLIISTAVSGLFALFARHGNAARVSEPEVKPVRLLERLPQHKRGKLISMSVSDHYVAITTDRGKELVLMRFRDAMAECEGCEGVQIHRSHWIALNQITNVLRLDGKTLIETSAGERLPVSRSFAETLKERGVI